MQLLGGKRALCLAVFLLSLCQCITAANPYRGPYNEPQCTDPQSGRKMYIGDAYTRSGQCIRVQCLHNLHIWEDNCQVPKLNGNCAAIPTANEFLDYPQCCPQYECKESSHNERGETVETRTYDHYGRLRKTHITQLLVADARGGPVKTQFEI